MEGGNTIFNVKNVVMASGELLLEKMSVDF
jgi:hypothetical protein